jgi:GNAT superfamily N-acetyltransferase
MLENKGLVVFDEFTSVVDRTVAKIGSAAVAKAVRSGRSCEKFVAVTCHYDVIDWLEPDWVLDMASGQLARGRLWRRPEIRIRIYKSAPEHWRLFAKHHYLDSKDLRGGVTCYMAEFDNCPVCFVAVRSSIGRVGVRRISRIVTMPDFQGVGIGMAVLNAVSELILRAGAKRVRITTGHPAMMRGLQRSKRWRCDNFQKLGASHIGKSGMQRINGSSSRGRAVAHFEFQPSAGSEIAPCSQPKELAH